MKWKKFTLKTTTEAVDYISSLFDEIGIQGIEIEDNVPLTESETKGMFIDILPELPPDDGTARVSFYLDDDDDAEAILKEVDEGLSELRQYVEIGEGTITASETEDKDWINNWKQYFKPFTVGERLLIKPSWETCENPRNRAVLEIDPASSFGTGQHHTTRLCLELLEQLMHPGDRVLDLGCGSGILSIGALLLGASGATAVDIEENAAATATENARKNHIDPTLYRVFCGNVLEDETLCREIGDGYDLICANIVADVLIAMKQLFRRFLRPEGTLIVSGIIMERRDEVLDQLKSAGFTLLEVREKEGWAAASLRIS